MSGPFEPWECGTPTAAARVLATLPAAQRDAMERTTWTRWAKDATAHRLRIPLITLEALHRRGLVHRQGDTGLSLRMITYRHRWPLTDLGRAVQEELASHAHP